ncbi:hypothetical protein MJL73_13125, partial [Salmonella enterica subsp. enterica serovar Lubbock]|nr:hypothetical protein [Salmonella enterica subsp. enterica serovar Lubbock]
IADKDKQIVDKDQLISDLKEALLKLQEQNDSLQAQIAAARTGAAVRLFQVFTWMILPRKTS